MFTAGSATSGTAAEDQRPEVTEKITVAKLLFAMTGLYERWKNELEARRYRDPREQDPDYGQSLRALEGDIRETEPRLQMGNYNESGEGKDTSWQKWILGIVGGGILLMLAWALGKLDTLSQEVATLQATQTMGFAAIAQRQTADEQRIDRVESHVFRGSP